MVSVCHSSQWWDAAGLRCLITDLQRVFFTTQAHASRSVVTLGLSCVGFVLRSAWATEPGVHLPQNVVSPERFCCQTDDCEKAWCSLLFCCQCQCKACVLSHPSQHMETTSWFTDPMTSSLRCSTCATSRMNSAVAPRGHVSLTTLGVVLPLFVPKVSECNNSWITNQDYFSCAFMLMWFYWIRGSKLLPRTFSMTKQF